MILKAQGSCLSASQRQILTQLQNQTLRFHNYKLLQKQNSTKNCKLTGNELSDDLNCTNTTSGFFQTNSTATSSLDKSAPISSADPVDLFSTTAGDDDLPGVVVTTPETDHLPEEDLAFLTDDLLAQLNGSEATAGLDLVELALFSGGSNSTDQHSLSSNQLVSDEKSIQIRCNDTTSVSSLLSSTQTQQQSTCDLASKYSLDSKHPHFQFDIGSSTGESQFTGPVELHTYLTKPLYQPTSITAALNINLSSSQVIKDLI